MKAACSWSGGKDSALAFWKAKQQGFAVEKIINFVNSDSGRCCFHGIPAGLIKDQAECMNVELLQVDMPEPMDDYEDRFRQMLRELKTSGFETMVFGDIYLDEHKEWIERVCGLEQMSPILPLWGAKPVDLIKEMESIGLTTIVVSCLERLGEDFVGKRISPDLNDFFLKEQICPCGEHGEYHTIVTDGPMFLDKKIDLGDTKKVLKDGFWKHWHLDIKTWNLDEKNRQR